MGEFPIMFLFYFAVESKDFGADRHVLPFFCVE